MIRLEVLVWDKIPICMIARLPEQGQVYLCSLDSTSGGTVNYECEPVDKDTDLYQRSIPSIREKHPAACLLSLPESMLKENEVPLSCLKRNPVIPARSSQSAM